MVDDRRRQGHRHAGVEAPLACFEEANKKGLGGGDGSQHSVYWASRGKP